MRSKGGPTGIDHRELASLYAEFAEFSLCKVVSSRFHNTSFLRFLAHTTNIMVATDRGCFCGLPCSAPACSFTGVCLALPCVSTRGASTSSDADHRSGRITFCIPSCTMVLAMFFARLRKPGTPHLSQATNAVKCGSCASISDAATRPSSIVAAKPRLPRADCSLATKSVQLTMRLVVRVRESGTETRSSRLVRESGSDAIFLPSRGVPVVGIGVGYIFSHTDVIFYEPNSLWS